MNSTHSFTRRAAGIIFWLVAASALFSQTAPVVYTQPSPVTINAGQAVTFYASATGNPSPTYQWQRLPAGSSTWANLSDTDPYSGTSSYYFTISLGTEAMNGDQFRFIATNTSGSDTSASALLTVNPAIAPQVFGLSAAITVNSGDYLNFNPSLSGTQPMTFQWKKDGTAITNATSSYFYKSSVTSADAGQYVLTVTNYAGTATSSAVTVAVNPAVAPGIYNLPATLAVNSGSSFSFSPTIAGTQPITFQWKKDGVAITNAISSYFPKSNATTADSGVYTLSATNSVGTTVSSSVTVTVNAPVAPAIFNLPATLSLNYGDSLSLNPSLSGSQPMTYQWKKGGVAIANATSNSYSIYATTTADSGQYTLTVTNSVSTVTSSAVAVTVNAAVAPVVYNLPASLSVNYGQSFSFSPSVSGSPSITYQWKKDGVAIPNATSSYFYSPYSVTTADNGQYTLTATNSVGTFTSAAVAVTVNPAIAPVISNLPSTLTLDYGATISIYPNVSGTQPISYQWKKGGVAIPNATSGSYYKSNVTTADSGLYTLTATNSAGTVTSSEITTTVNAAVAPAISNLPATVTVDYGSSLSIDPTVTGTQPITFQWKKDGAVVIGANSSYYSKYNGVTTADSGQYTLVATNSVGTVTSASVTVTVNAPIPPVISNLPATLTMPYGSSLSLNPTIAGTQPMTYQWKKDGVAIANATSSYYYKYYGVTTADSGQYTLTVTNTAGTVTSSTVTITVQAAVAPVISNLPANLTVAYGESLNLNPGVTGTQPITFQWKKDGVALANATSSYYSVNATTAESGQYTLVATNEAGSVTSSTVTVTVQAAIAPGIFNLPATLTVGYGTSLSLNPVVTGSRPMTYQWKKDGVTIPNAVSSIFSSTVTTVDSGLYTLTATNVAGTTTSSAVTVTVNAAVTPVIFNLPPTLTIEYGTTLSLNPTVTGTQPMTYQWRKDGVSIANATASYYSNYSNVTTAESGQYTLTATNAAGSTTSSPVTVVVNPAVAPAIYNLPSAVTVDYAGYLYLSPSVSGTSPVVYQWKKDGVAINNAASNYYSHSNVTATDGGVYTLTATNVAGTVTSSSVTVSVNPAVAPGIFNLPPTLTFSYGGYLNLNPSITGTQPMTYQWKKNGVAIANAISSSYYNSYLTTAEAGAYTLEVTNLVGTTVSSTLTITVDAAIAPSFTVQPVSLSMNPGLTANFTVVATGTSPITYQWNLDGQPISGATYSSLAIPNVQAENVGSYTVVATNPGGSITSNAATLSLNTLGVVSASAGYSSSFLIKPDGTLWAMGANYYGALGDGTTTERHNPIQISSNVVSVAAGGSHGLFLKADGTLWAMGNNDYGQLGDGTMTDRYSPVQIATGVVSIAAGNVHSLFIKSDGTLWVMGNNDYGQLGDATTSHRYLPVQIAIGVRSVSAGSYHSLFIKSDGTLWAMGNNPNGQLGDGTSYVNRSTPLQVATGVSSAAAGANHSLFIKLDGTLWAMGYNYYGQLGDGTSYNSHLNPEQIATGVASVSAGESHSLFIKSDGTLWAMGYNYYGQLGDGTSYNSHLDPEQIATGVASAVAGSAHSLFVKQDGTFWAMGYNGYGQLGNGTTTYPQSTPVEILAGTVAKPGVPSVVVASDGAINTGVRLTWSPTVAATQYEVWRATSNDSASATLLASNVPSALYYDLTAVSGSTYYYWIKAGNSAGNSSYSSSDGGFVGVAPAITTQPTNQIVTVGGSVTFTAAASGTPAPTFQWKKGGVAISGATGSSFTIASAATGDAGTYTVVATNAINSDTSNSATLTVNAPLVNVRNDFDGDGKADILLSNTVTGDRALWQMNGTAIGNNAFVGTVPASWVISSTGDFNGDGKADIFWTNTATGDRAVWLMNGSAATGGGYLGSIPVEWIVGGSGDFDGDGKADILWSNTVTGERSMWLMNGSATSGGGSLGVIPVAWVVSGTGDFNGDGKADIILSDTVTGDRAIWFMNGTTISTNAFAGTVPPAWLVSGVGDFDGDGKADIFWTNTATGDRAVWLMNGNTAIGGGYMGSVPVEWIVSSTGDFNGDGKADILWSNTSTGERSMWLMNGSTTSGGGSLGIVPVAWVTNN